MHLSFLIGGLLLFTCQPDLDTCQVPDFENQWLQAYYSGESVSNCYKFLDDGYLLMTDGITTWPTGRWTGTSYECYVTIETDAGILDIYYGDPCFEVESEFGDFQACECEYNL